MKIVTFRLRHRDQVRRAWYRASLRTAARVLRQWNHHESAELLIAIANAVPDDPVAPALTGWDE